MSPTTFVYLDYMQGDRVIEPTQLLDQVFDHASPLGRRGTTRFDVDRQQRDQGLPKAGWKDDEGVRLRGGLRYLLLILSGLEGVWKHKEGR